MRSPAIPDKAAETARPLPQNRTEGPVVIDVSGVEKTFRIPDQRIDSLKERFTNPFQKVEYRTLRALRDVSFEVHRGEFFGIVGRNGSGKSTLLKIMASIYRADAGRVRMAGRVAPFIELGVGFNPELTARENVVLNGVLMGLTRTEARSRLGEVIEFAELEEFVDLKIKNYSSGMMVRLAFAIMVQADADVMLIDEVLAVGDASFAQKCMDVFQERRRQGKTIVLVTHDMATVQSLCHRAMVLDDGELRYIGPPEEAALRYYRLNFDEHAGHAPGAEGEPDVIRDLNVRVVEALLRDANGTPVENFEDGSPIRVDIVFEAARDLERPIFVFHVVTGEGVVVAEFTRTLEEHVSQGRQVRLSGEIENRLVSGRYFLDCWVRQDEEQSVMALQALRLLRFLIFGSATRHGVVTLEVNVEPRVEPPA
jgi:ABC-type polysaccharide/polyol phosphate transport system ATPase subunit